MYETAYSGLHPSHCINKFILANRSAVCGADAKIHDIVCIRPAPDGLHRRSEWLQFFNDCAAVRWIALQSCVVSTEVTASGVGSFTMQPLVWC